MYIRHYKPADKLTIIELLRYNIPQYFAPEEESSLADYLENHLDLYFVVEDAGKIVGCGGINRSADGKSAVLSWDIIHPDSQGKGVGSALTVFRIQKLKKLDIENIGVRTSQHVYQFYAKMGFELKEILKNYWADGFDLYRMEFNPKSSNKQFQF